MIVNLTSQFLSNFKHENNRIEEEVKLKISVESELCYKEADDILASLNKIHFFMSQNKEKYFSNAAYSRSAFTDQQRNDFDRQVKEFIDSCSYKINQFQKVTEQIVFSNCTQKQHLKNVALCLYQRQKQTTKLFKQFLQFNQNRKRKIQAMIGNHTKPQIQREKKNKAQAISSRKNNNFDQELEQESQAIFMEKMSEQKQIEQTRKTLQKINKVLDAMSNKVLEQELLTSSFREIGTVGLFNIQQGNKNLVKANQISKDTGKYWTWYFLSLALSLLFFDFIKS